jgi:pyruvate/2-oxoglutarate dehydrogenase complex dihydrolipoamide dehydrogenase (E3) component
MRIAVVGAGPSGLGCANELAMNHDVILIDRLPVIGGESGWRETSVLQFASKAHELGILFELGSMAIRWDGVNLLIVGPLGTKEISADHLFFAGGVRPATSAEIGISGDRPAGVIPASVALHLLESEVLLWKNTIVIGHGQLALKVISAITHYGGVCTNIVADAVETNTNNRQITNATKMKVHGRARVDKFECEVNGENLQFECDGIILAGPLIPNRNLEGALIEPSKNVTFVQDINGSTPESRYENGSSVARNWTKAQGGSK